MPGSWSAAEPQPPHAQQQAAARHLEPGRHRVEVAAQAGQALLDLLAWQVGCLAQRRRALDPLVEGRARDAETGRGGLQPPPVGAERRLQLLLADLLGTAIVLARRLASGHDGSPGEV